MLRKAGLLMHPNRRQTSTLQDAMQRAEALKLTTPQPILPIIIDQSGAGEELG